MLYHCICFSCLFAMKCERSIRLINEAFVCNVLHSDLTETRIQLLHSALQTQNMACVHFQCRGMINGLLSGVLHSTFILVFFWEATSLPPKKKKKKKVYGVVKLSVFLKHIFQIKCPIRMKKGFLSLWWYWASIMYAGEMSMYLPQLDASSSDWWLFWQFSNSPCWQSKRPCAIQSKTPLSQ